VLTDWSSIVSAFGEGGAAGLDIAQACSMVIWERKRVSQRDSTRATVVQCIVLDVVGRSRFCRSSGRDARTAAALCGFVVRGL
jgi:hypothetical protein